MIRILFVDNDPAALSEQRSMLRAYRQEWAMGFCEGAQEALGVLESQPFDVVVSDIQMLDMAGAELLRQVRDLYPSTVRILIGSKSEQDHILRATNRAHQFLPKPFDPECLRITVTRACGLNRRTHNPEVQSLVGRMESLPSLPVIYHELVAELQSEDASVNQVGALISRDVGMTAKVLQLVNSSFFGLPVHVEDARHAAALLGLNTLKPLVLTACVFRQLEESRVPVAFLEQVISHSMAVGGAAKQIAKCEGLRGEILDNAFIGGAIHDIGKIVLADNLGAEYTSMLERANAEDLSIASLEIEQWGASHADVGGWLLALWGLPEELLEAVAYHHDPSSSIDSSFSALTAVHLADRFFYDEGNESTDDSEPTLGIDVSYVSRLGMDNRLASWREAAAECFALA